MHEVLLEVAEYLLTHAFDTGKHFKKRLSET